MTSLGFHVNFRGCTLHGGTHAMKRSGWSIQNGKSHVPKGTLVLFQNMSKIYPNSRRSRRADYDRHMQNMSCKEWWSHGKLSSWLSIYSLDSSWSNHLDSCLVRFHDISYPLRPKKISRTLNFNCHATYKSPMSLKGFTALDDGHSFAGCGSTWFDHLHDIWFVRVDAIHNWRLHVEIFGLYMYSSTRNSRGIRRTQTGYVQQVAHSRYNLNIWQKDAASDLEQLSEALHNCSLDRR